MDENAKILVQIEINQLMSGGDGEMGGDWELSVFVLMSEYLLINIRINPHILLFRFQTELNRPGRGHSMRSEAGFKGHSDNSNCLHRAENCHLIV